MLLAQFRPALILFALLTLITGVIYPLLVTGVAQTVFHHQAEGSLIVSQDGKILGSHLIGQHFDDPKYFWGRLSATTPAYNASASMGSNWGPLNPALLAQVKARKAALKAVDPRNTLPLPVDLVTSSGSGLDPHISLAAAYYQVARVAWARGLSVEVLRSMVNQHAQGRVLGVLGEPVVNVLEINLELDKKV
jgi:potassium-transporting ATPase KdpC subunit